ncbi:hypothetical protein QYF36_017261 [Acer negundo]|nr:hypothetical protein QYF36_017261 [Acer negundo]
MQILVSKLLHRISTKQVLTESMPKEIKRIESLLNNFSHTDFKLASSHHPLNDKVAHECGFTSLSVRIVKTIRLRKLSMFVSYARNIVGVSVHFHPLKMAKSNFASPQFELKTVNSDPSISLQPTWRHGSEYPRKRRILCLHRFRQNASSFKGRNASLAKKLKNILSLFLSLRPMSCHSFINLLMHYLCCKVVHHHHQRTVERSMHG